MSSFKPISITKTHLVGNNKAYTYNYIHKSINSLEELADIVNNYSVSGPKYKDGHRANSSIIEGSNYIFIDCDEEGQAEEVEARIYMYDYIKVPSRSFNKFPYKVHFILPTQEPMSIYPLAYDIQVAAFMDQVGIKDSMFDSSISKGISSQFAPAVIEPYKDKKSIDGKEIMFISGLSIEEANDATEIHYGEMHVPVIAVDPIYNEPGIVSKHLKTVKKDGILEVEGIPFGFSNAPLTPVESLTLDRDASVYFKGYSISVVDAENIVYSSISRGDNTYVSGFGCPVGNPKHTYDVREGYAFAFLDNITNEVNIKCIGKSCSHIGSYRIPTHKASPMIATPIVNVESKELAESFKTVWEEKLNNISSDNLIANWSNNFQAFSESIKQNKENSIVKTKFICPSSTGSGKTQQIIHKSISLHGTKTNTLIVTLRTKDADEIASQILESTDDSYVGVYHSKEVSIENVIKLNEPSTTQCVVVTHAMFNKHQEKITSGRDFVVVDEAIDAITELSISHSDLKRLLIATKPISHFDFIKMISGINLTLNKILEEGLIKNNKYRNLSELLTIDEIPCSIMTRQYIESDEVKPADIFTGLKQDHFTNIRAKNRLIEIITTFEKILSGWNYLYNNSGELTFHTASEVIPNKSIVIMDATATVNYSYTLAQQYNEGLIKVYPQTKCRDYSNVSLHICRTSTGRTTLNNKSRLSGLVSNIINNTNPGDTILIATFKDLVIDLTTYTNSIEDRTTFVDNWGNLTGTNRYNKCNKIFLFGLNHKASYLSNNIHALIKTPARALIETNENRQETNLISSSGLASEVIQAINRIHCRNVIDKYGNCLPTDVYITLPSRQSLYDEILTAITSEMTNINIGDKWNLEEDTDIVVHKNTTAEHYLEQLELMCIANPDIAIRHMDVMSELGLTKKQYSDNVKNKKIFKHAIESYYDIELKPSIDKFGRKRKKKESYYMLK